MESRIRRLQAHPGHAVIVDDAAVGSSETVATGSAVAIRYEGDDEVERFFVGSIEERHDELNVVSPGSPLGQALLGKRAGRRGRVRGAGRQAAGRDRPDRQLIVAAAPAAPPARSVTRCGSDTSSTGARVSPICCSSTCTWCTRSRRPRPSTVCGWRAGPCATPSSRWPRPTTTCPPPTSTSPSPTRCRPASSRCCRPTAPSSASRATRWATPTRASSTSSAPSWG